MTNPGETPFDNYATSAHPSAPFEIPGFRIIGELGRGAFGVVYQAHDIAIDRPVAIKVALVDEPARRDEYVQEAQKAAKLNIEGVVPVYQVGRLDNGRPFVVQMLLEGGTLRQEMKRPGGIPPKRICELMIRVGQVVAQAHGMGLIHRDLKPDNILLDRRGQPWVGDFGLALSETDQRLHKGEKAGTPLYMSPEQIQGRAEWLDGRADIYALGVIFYELLVGRPPFTARSRQELEEEILYRDPKPLTQYLTGIPNEFDQIFRRCCAKQTNDRYANAMDLVKDLELVHESMDYADVHLIESSGKASHLHTSSRLSGKSTRRNSVQATERDEVPRATPDLKLWVAMGTFVLVACSMIAFSYRQIFVSDPRGPKEERKEPEIPPVRPLVLRVSQDPKRHALRTIADAIKLARPGETITIEAGKYVENLVLAQDVSLVGDENARPTIVALDAGDTIAITNNANVTLRNLSLDNMSKEANTIHVQQGTLSVDNCVVVASSFNCLKSLSSPSVKLAHSTFRNGAHEAVYVEGVQSFQVEDCEFAISTVGFANSEQHPYGIQAVKCAGSVVNSTFNERGQRGISWQDATGPVTLENNSFNSCDFPIKFVNVAQASIQGDTTMVDCRNGIELQDSAVTIRGLKMKGSGKPKTNGIRIFTEKVPSQPSLKRIQIFDSRLEGFEQGLDVVDKSVEITLSGVTLQENETGINLEVARRATLSDCTLSKCAIAGLLLVDCPTELKDCTFNQVPVCVNQTNPFENRGLICDGTTFQFGGPRSVALRLKSGSAELKDSHVRDMGFVALFASGDTNSVRKLEINTITAEDCSHGLAAEATGVATIKGEVRGIDLLMNYDKRKFQLVENPPKRYSIIAKAGPS